MKKHLQSAMGGVPKSMGTAHDKENKVQLTKMSLDEVQSTRSAQRGGQRQNMDMQSEASVGME